MTFEETGLSSDLLKAVTKLGFEHPTPIQEQTIPALLTSDRDMIALAQTGTGKTAAFGLPVIEQIVTGSNTTQALILCPTRELCMQISHDLADMSEFVENLRIAAVYGGAGIEAQIKNLKKGCQIVVATPGRAMDLINRRVLKVNEIKWLILDEADEMLSMGFKEELSNILADTPEDKQTLLFSATMPKEIKAITKKYMSSPNEITVGKRNTGAENVNHFYYIVQAKDRYAALKRITDINPEIYGIVFCRTRLETQQVADNLIRDGYNADALHGDMSQAQRDQVMNRFRSKHLQILVATDVAARGLDVDDLTHIINYNLPDEPGAYIHRSGRTGRAGKSGTSITIIHSRERGKIIEIEKKVGKKFERNMIPTGREVCEKQLYHYIDKVKNIDINETQIKRFLDDIYDKLSGLTREELIQHFVSITFNNFLAYYDGSTDLNISARNSENEKDNNVRKGRKNKNDRNNTNGRKKNSNTEFSRFYINIGAKNKISPMRLMGILNDRLKSRKFEIGKIDIMRKFSFFEVDTRISKDLVKAFKDAHHGDIPLIVEQVKDTNNPEKGKSDKKKKKKK